MSHPILRAIGLVIVAIATPVVRFVACFSISLSLIFAAAVELIDHLINPRHVARRTRSRTVKHHANRDLREVYWQPDPELERLKKLRGEVMPTKVPYVPPPYEPRYGEYGNRAILKAHREKMERELREADRKRLLQGDPLLEAEKFVGMIVLIVACTTLGLWIASLL